MRCLVVLMLVAACFAEPPSNKENTSSESKDKRGAISHYDHGDAYHGSSAAIALPATSLGYGALGHSSLLLPQTHGLGLLTGGLGHSGYSGYSGLLASPLALGGHGLALNAQPIVLGHLGHGLAAPAFGGLGYGLGGHGLGGHGLSGLSFGIPTSSIKLSPSTFSHGDSLSLTDSYSSGHGHSYHGASLTPPSKSYGVPSSSDSYSSGFQPSHSSYSSYSGSSSYSSPSSSYGPPSSSYGPPSSSYGVPSSSHSSSYNTVPYSSGSSHHSRDYRSH